MTRAQILLAGFYVEGFVCASVKCKHHILVFAEVHRSKNGEGGIRTHEGVTPTRFRVVRDQPDSATSPCACLAPKHFRASPRSDLRFLWLNQERCGRVVQNPTQRPMGA